MGFSIGYWVIIVKAMLMIVSSLWHNLYADPIIMAFQVTYLYDICARFSKKYFFQVETGIIVQTSFSSLLCLLLLLKFTFSPLFVFSSYFFVWMYVVGRNLNCHFKQQVHFTVII